MRARLRLLLKAIQHKLVVDDALGHNLAIFNAQEWKYLNDPAKVEAFRKWLQAQIDAGLLEVGNDNEPWSSEYVHSAYKKGIARAFADSQKAKLGRAYDGARTFFLAQALTAPESIEKLRMLSLRSLESLRGVTAPMAANMTKSLLDGLAHGLHPRQVAREMAKQAGLTYTRALVIARTELIHAHAEGQLDSFEGLGEEGVGVLAEWSTAGDHRVCGECAEREGEVLTIAEARGLIPMHPNCRCAWLPVTQVAARKRRKRGRANAT